MKSIKAKLVLAIGLIIVAVFTLSGFFLIQQKRQELSEDLFFNAMSFAELTNESVVRSYKDFYLTESFLHFNRDIRASMEKTVDIDHVALADTSGNLLYDSVEEVDQQYRGPVRQSVYDPERMKDIKSSVLFTNGTLAYVQRGETGAWRFVDRGEQPVEVSLLQEIDNIVFPSGDLRTAVVYEMTYDHFKERILSTIQGILLFILVSIALSIVVSIKLAGKLVVPIKLLEKGADSIAKGKLGAQVQVTTADEIGRLTQTFNKMSKDLKRNTEQLVESEKLSAEIDLAKEIQDQMLPARPPEVEGLALAGSLVSATAIGGDFYDFFQPDRDNFYMLIADVTGHGVPAGLVAAITSSLAVANAAYLKKPHDILEALNGVLHTKTKPNMFATALLARWEVKANRFTYCSAGHDQIIHYQASKKKAVLAHAGGIALGMTPDLRGKLKEEQLSVAKGDFLMLYTDGFPEAWRSGDENLGMERLVGYAEQVGGKAKTAEEFKDLMVKKVNEFRKGFEQKDDMTLVVAKRV